MKYEVICEQWKIPYVGDVPQNEFFEYAHDNPSGCETSETIGVFDTLEEAENVLSKYRCNYEVWKNYGETRFEIYELNQLILDEDGDIEDIKFVKYAEIKVR